MDVRYVRRLEDAPLRLFYQTRRKAGPLWIRNELHASARALSSIFFSHSSLLTMRLLTTAEFFARWCRFCLHRGDDALSFLWHRVHRSQPSTASRPTLKLLGPGQIPEHLRPWWKSPSDDYAGSSEGSIYLFVDRATIPLGERASLTDGVPATLRMRGDRHVYLRLSATIRISGGFCTTFRSRR